MKKAKLISAKRSFFMSVLSLILCFAMLIGTTYAWFTDSVTSGTNRIVAGNLDVEMFYKSNGQTDWHNVTEAPATDPGFFVNKDNTKILWEPGVVSVCDFEVRNVGNLALKYKFNTEVTDGNDAGSTKKLSSVIQAAVVASTTDVSTREKAIEAGTTAGFVNLAGFAAEGDLNPTVGEAKDVDSFKVVLYWAPTDHDNDYNMNNENQGKQMWIDFDVKLIATQLEYEEDSFDKTYDAEATYPGNTASASALVFKEGSNNTIVTGLAEGDTSETIVIPATATKIAENAFKGNKNIKDITMPVNTEIGESAFEGCDNLENVTLVVPDGEVANVEFRAFAECEGLKNITVNGDANLTEATFQFDSIEHATEVATDYVFNGNVTVGDAVFSSNYSSSGGGTVIFNGDVTFDAKIVNHSQTIPFIFAQVDNIIFNCDGKNLDFGSSLVAYGTGANLIFNGVPATFKIGNSAFNGEGRVFNVYCDIAAWKTAGFLADTVVSGEAWKGADHIYDISELPAD